MFRQAHVSTSMTFATHAGHTVREIIIGGSVGSGIPLAATSPVGRISNQAALPAIGSDPAHRSAVGSHLQATVRVGVDQNGEKHTLTCGVVAFPHVNPQKGALL